MSIEIQPYFAEGERYPALIGVRVEGDEYETAYVSKSELVDALDENAKLKKLVQDMYGFIERMDEECGDVTFSDCFDYCKHDTTDDGCCKTGECWYEQRMRELVVDA